MSKALNDIRTKIDSIDNQVHDLLMERASLVSSIADAKREAKLPMVQPAREAKMLRRLLGRHEGPLPAAAIIRIWRELVGAVCLLQTGLNVIVFSEDENNPYWDMSKDYFGSVVPMKKINSTAAAIGAVRNDDASFAVLPWPELDEQSPWWSNLFDQHGEQMSVICSLPYGYQKGEGNLPYRALVVSKFEYLPSDDDYTFLGLELRSAVSRTRVVERLSEIGLSIANLYTSKSPLHDDSSVHLVEVKGYIDSDSEVLQHVSNNFEGDCLYCGVVGGYPAVPEFDD